MNFMNNKESESIVPLERIEGMIYFLRNKKVMLDEDLAKLYGVKTKRLNEQLRRNKDRFPEDFVFQLTDEEWNTLKSQFATSSSDWGGRRKLPMAFTEHGVAMAANLLKSKRAIKVSVEIVRAFIRMRQVLASHKEISKGLAELKSFLLKHSNQTNREFKRVWDVIEKLAKPMDKERKKIGFDLN